MTNYPIYDRQKTFIYYNKGTCHVCSLGGDYDCKQRSFGMAPEYRTCNNTMHSVCGCSRSTRVVSDICFCTGGNITVRIGIVVLLLFICSEMMCSMSTLLRISGLSLSFISAPRSHTLLNASIIANGGHQVKPVAITSSATRRS